MHQHLVVYLLRLEEITFAVESRAFRVRRPPPPDSYRAFPMAPIRPALAQSESKARFFERLGMSERDERHRRLYAMMKVGISEVTAYTAKLTLSY